MNVISVEKKEKSTVELTIQVEADVFEAAVQKSYQHNRSKITVPGFRKGKAPRKIIEGMYGADIFYEDAINDVYPGAYDQAVKEQGLDDVGRHRVELVSAGKEGLTFKALVSVRPEVKLGTYKGLSAEKEAVKVTDEDIDNELKTYINRATRLVSVQRAAQDGDTVVIDFEGFDNGTPFEGGKGQNYDLKIGSGSFVPGFEEQMVGMNPGEEKDIDITFPEDYHADLAGKAVVFHVKVNEVKESQAPVVDDEFAKDVSEFETLDEFRKDLGEKLAQRREEQAQRDYENKIIDQLIEGMECEIPDDMVDIQLDRLVEDYANRIQSQGISMDEYLKMMGMNVQMLRSSMRSSALRQVQLELALGAVADAEQMTADDEEVTAEIKRLAEQYGLSTEQVSSIVSTDDLKQDLRLRKASDLVVAEAKATKAKKKTTKKSDEAKTEGEGEEKPKRTRKKKVSEETAEAAEGTENKEEPQAE
jgi:trigger factor